MWREGLAKLLREEIEALLALLSNTAGLYDMVKEPLSKVRGDSVSDTAQGRAWFFLPLMVCEAICGRYEHALPAAAGLALLKAAAEVFDDIEDADSTESLSSRYGPAQAINAGSALLILAERAFTRLNDRGVDSHIVVRVIDVVNSYYTTACAGQHLDLSLIPAEAVSEDVYLKVIAMKSASAVACACYTGALLAKANQELIDLFTMFGHNLGMASQIANDIKGVTQLTDIVKRKITLPAIYALAQTDGETHSLLDTVFCKRASEFAPVPAQIRELLFRSGAIQYATIKMELYQQQALDNLIEAERDGVKVDQLKPLLE